MKKCDISDIFEELMERDNPGDFLRAEGIETLGMGKTRVCVKIENTGPYDCSGDGLCAKIPFNKEGVFQNSQEVYIWDYLIEISDYLLPIIDYDEKYRFVIMPIAENLENFDNSSHIVTTLEENLSKYDNIKAMDLNADNCVIYNGEPYVSDYGMIHPLE